MNVGVSAAPGVPARAGGGTPVRKSLSAIGSGRRLATTPIRACSRRWAPSRTACWTPQAPWRGAGRAGLGRAPTLRAALLPRRQLSRADDFGSAWNCMARNCGAPPVRASRRSPGASRGTKFSVTRGRERSMIYGGSSATTRIAGKKKCRLIGSISVVPRRCFRPVSPWARWLDDPSIRPDRPHLLSAQRIVVRDHGRPCRNYREMSVPA